MIKIIEGNIVNAKTDFIIHQVNCQGEMNTGVAKVLRDYDEGIYKHYRKFCEFCKFESEELLGTCDAYLLKDRGQIVLSLFAQNKYGYDGKQYTDIEAFISLLRNIRRNIIVHIINIMDGIFIGLQQCRISVKVLHQKRL